MKSAVRFYVASRETATGNNDWGKATLAEAIDHAKRIIEKTGEEQYVVKVIKVVRRRPQPIIIETVR